jgi:hypothetical protein
MSFSALADNQCVSYNNLQSGVSQGYFDAKTTIPSTNQESTKTAAYTYVNIDPNYPPYAAKLDNQLVVKSDLKDNVAAVGISNGFFTGTITDVQVNGVSITGASFPLDIGNGTLGYTDQIGTYDITLYYADADMPSNWARCYDSDYNTVCIDGFTSLGPGPYYVTFPSQVINTINQVSIETGDGGCIGPTPPPLNLGVAMTSVAVSKNTGQYMVATSGTKMVINCNYTYTVGSLNVSSNYGATWTRIAIDNYWTKVAVSGDGHYMLAVSAGGYAYQSTNYGSTWSFISALPAAVYTGCAISGDGQYQTIVGQYSGAGFTYYAYRSLNYGVTWTSIFSSAPSNKNFSGCAMTSDGVRQVIVTGIDQVGGYPGDTNAPYDGYVYYSSNGTSTPVTFNEGSISAAYVDQWYTDVTCSPSGDKLFTTMSNTPSPGSGPFKLYKSTNYGVNWTMINGNNSWIGVTANDTSISLGVVCGNTYIKTINASNVVSDLTGSGVKSWTSVDADNGGTYILAGASDGLFLSTNGGISFTAL